MDETRTREESGEMRGAEEQDGECNKVEEKSPKKNKWMCGEGLLDL